MQILYPCDPKTNKVWRAFGPMGSPLPPLDIGQDPPGEARKAELNALGYTVFLIAHDKSQP